MTLNNWVPNYFSTYLLCPIKSYVPTRWEGKTLSDVVPDIPPRGSVPPHSGMSLPLIYTHASPTSFHLFHKLIARFVRSLVCLLTLNVALL